MVKDSAVIETSQRGARESEKRDPRGGGRASDSVNMH
jgi:hypothetical protein